MQRADYPESGEQLFLQQLPLIDRLTAFVCSRNHLAAADVDDFASEVKLKLIEDDYAVLRKFEGRSTLKTYLTTVIQRLFLDYRISAWGKWRPSANAKRCGAVALLLEQFLTRDGHTFDEACELLWTKHQVKADRSQLEQIAATLPDRVKRRFERDDALADAQATTMPPDEAVELTERQSTARRVAAVMKVLLARLGTQDRLLLAQCFHDGRTVAEIAKLAQVDQKWLYRHFKRLAKDLRRGLERAGIQAADVVAMLEHPAVHLEWDRDWSRGEKPPSSSIKHRVREWL
jgi:RNA polymerase sigma factor for flagellar operon FliA